MTAPATITVAALDTLSGERLTDVELPVRRVVRLNCGCDRLECDRPGGGTVEVLRGSHCDRRG